MIDTRQDFTDRRQKILEQIELCTRTRGFLLDCIRLTAAPEDYDDNELLKLALRMFETDLARHEKSLDYEDGRISGAEYIHWCANNSAIKQIRLIGIRDFLEDKSDKMLLILESFERRHGLETILQQIKDDLLKHSHDLEQFGAIMENDDSLVIPDPNEPVVRYCGLPIRFLPKEDGGITLDATDMIAIMRILAGETQSMDEQPYLNMDEAMKEYGRLVSQLLLTPEMDRFLKWAKTILDGKLR